MTSGRCACLAEDARAALQAIRKGRRIAELADESHFHAAVSRCESCGQRFLTLFCECVDWADGEDPQTWIAAPVSEDEAQQLLAANIAADENAMLRIVPSERRFLYHDMPKGAPETLAWVTRMLFIPGHD
jgi:hypothetical protein